MKPSRATLGTLLFAGAVAAVVLPTLVFRYLPMTDLPQHAAVTAILRHLHDPRYGFEAHYQLAPGRTLYVLPYLLAAGLSWIFPVTFATQIVVALSVAAYPVGAWLLFRAQRKPPLLVLFTLPLVFNRAFYWGFVNFLLSIGLALAALSLLVDERRSWPRDLALALLLLAVATTHVYGIAFFVGYLVIWVLSGERAPIVRRLGALVPALAGTIVWTFLQKKAPGYGRYEYVDPITKLKEIPDSILGGFRDSSETFLLAAFVAAFLVAELPSLPLSWRRWGRLGRHEKIAYAYALANLILYFIVPLSTPTAKWVHFRHALLTAMLLPLAATGEGLRRRPRARGSLVAAVALLAVANAWAHLFRFHREARGFDQVLAALPERPRVAGLIFDTHGQVMKTHPYLHFAAYAQATKGGLVAVSFPRLFWNIPVAFREDSGAPKIPANFEWTPRKFGDARFGGFFDHVIARVGPGDGLPGDFPFDLVAESGRWRLYRRR